MAYRHEDDYKKGKLIRKICKSEKCKIETEDEKLLEVKHLNKLKGPKEGIFRCGNEGVSHIQRQRQRRSTGRYNDLTRDYNTKG